jgi:hypothetical protein
MQKTLAASLYDHPYSKNHWAGYWESMKVICDFQEIEV